MKFQYNRFLDPSRLASVLALVIGVMHPVGLLISTGSAQVTANVTGEIEVVAMPPSLLGGVFTNQTYIRLMHEGIGTVTAGMPGFQADGAYHNPALGVGQPADATFANAIVTPYAGPGLPAVGTGVYSILLHFDPNLGGLPLNLAQGIARTGTITFNRQILGVYVTSGALNATDAIFGSGTVYPTSTGRDMEFNYDGDFFSIASNRYELSVTMFVHNGGIFDEMRIILATNTPPVVAPMLSEPAWQDGVFQLSVPTLSGKLYTMEFTDQLPGTNWTDVQSVNGDDTVRVLTDSTATNQQRFYRVRME